jgi:hypothetical protein
MTTTTPPYHCIGRGICGTIWTAPNSNHATKREDGGPERSLRNDHTMHTLIQQFFTLHPPSTPLSTPACHDLIQPSDTAWWSTHLPLFPPGLEGCPALVSEHIPPLSRSISNKIVDLICPNVPKLAGLVKSNLSDEHCLVRPYLGRRRNRSTGNTSRLKCFSLRNVPMHVDQMEDFGLDVRAYAETMAEALALMHWGTDVDAGDVEYVLAPPRSSSPSSAFQSSFFGEHTMWILDFDCVRRITMDGAGVERACKAFWENDPF